MSTAREHIVDVAEQLFYAEGFRAVGVDRVIKESGVAKATLYRHFPAKDDLLVAVLEARDERWRAWLEERVARLAKSPADRPLAVFDALAERFSSTDFRGCAFLNTMVEVARRDHAAHEAAARHKQRVVAFLEELLKDAGFARASILAPQLMLLMDGAIVTAVREGSADAARSARAIAANLLAAERKPLTTRRKHKQ